jgi:phenylpyruvate tautomerase PptA (4-oxalocrotonate tautomerase family)
MPLVRIEILKGRSADEKQRLLDAVHAALVEGFGIPDDDRTQRIVEHEAESFEIAPGAGERYSLIEITASPGRSADAKRRLYEAIVRNLGAERVPAEDVLRRPDRAADGELGHPRREAGERGRSRLPRRQLTLSLRRNPETYGSRNWFGSRSALVRPNCRFPLAFPSFPVSSRTRLDITSGPSPFARPRRLRRTVAQSRMDVRDRPVAPTSLRGTGELR